MVREFERCQETVVGRAVTITSWYDIAASTWRAGAPAYAHLYSVHHSSGPPCSSRKAAIGRLTSMLAQHIPPGKPRRY
jgi:hypothetical protein